MKRESEEIFPISDNLSDRICNLRWKFYFKYNRGFCWPRKWFIQILLEWRVETKMFASFDTKNICLMDNFCAVVSHPFEKVKIYHLTVLLLPEKFFSFCFVHMQYNFSFIFRFTIINARQKHKFCYYTL